MINAITDYLSEHGTSAAIAAYFSACVLLCMFLYSLGDKPDEGDD